VKTRLARKGLPPDELASKLREYERRRDSDEKKLDRMILYAQAPSCRWRFLLEYFEADPISNDEAPFRCGTCDNCRHPAEWDVAPPSPAEIFPRLADSPLPDPEPALRLRRGQKVNVPEYGEGEIDGFDGDKVEVRFADGERRTFKREFIA